MTDYITIHDVALVEGATKDDSGGYRGDQYAARGYAIISGCEGCGATLAPYNAYPSTSGYIRCAQCLGGDNGYPTVAAFHAVHPPVSEAEVRAALAGDVATANTQEPGAWLP